MTRPKIRTAVAALAAVGALAATSATANAEAIRGSVLKGGPGMATSGECAGYAGAANALEAQQGVNNMGIESGEHPDNAALDKLRGGILDAGVARGCVFTQL